MEFRDGLSAIASPRTVLSGRCNGEPIVSPPIRRVCVQQSLCEMSPRLSQPVTHSASRKLDRAAPPLENQRGRVPLRIEKQEFLAEKGSSRWIINNLLEFGKIKINFLILLLKTYDIGEFFCTSFIFERMDTKMKKEFWANFY